MSSYYEKMLATGEVKCIDEEIPFEVPKGWEWCRLRNIILGTNAGKSPNCEKRPKKSEEWGVLTTTSIQENAFLSNENKVLPKHYVITPEHCVRYGDILITRAGPVNRTGIVCMVENNCDKLILSDKTVRIDYMRDHCNPKFLVFVLNSTAIHDLVMSATVGMAASQVNVSQNSIQNTLIPFPPSKEQQKIINKLEALLPQIEKYDNAQNKLDELNKTVKDIIKKSILQEAIQGKLVPQLAEEDTAQELLEQIKAEKQKLVKEGKLKKSALTTSVIFRGDDNRYCEKIGKKIVCIEDEVPFEIPNSWVWARLGTIVDFSKSQTISSSMLDMDSWILDLEDIEKDSGRLLQKKRMKDLLSKSDKHLFYKGNVLYSKLRPYLNKVIVADEDGACTTEILAFDFGHIYNKYAQAYLMSPFFVDYANSDSYGIKMPRLGSKKGNNALFPIPPLREQQRIVEKIEQLMQLLK